MSSLLKPFARPALAGFLLAAGLTAISGTASALPAGSYLLSCQNVTQTGDLLRASCRTSAGALRATTFQISRCRKVGDNLSNIDGRLRCAEKLPRGTWYATCQANKGGIHYPVVFDGVLYAYCKGIDGHYSQPLTSITVSSCTGGVIANINGRLVCTR